MEEDRDLLCTKKVTRMRAMRQRSRKKQQPFCFRGVMVEELVLLFVLSFSAVDGIILSS